MTDYVSPEIRQIEKEIDEFYKSNLLLNLPFGTATWYLLAYYEDRSLFSMIKKPDSTMHEIAALSDNLVVELQYPLKWLWTGCQSGGRVNKAHSEELYRACQEFSDLAIQYTNFATAYTYASYGMVKLILDDTTIVPTSYVFKDSRYEVYGRLVPQEEPGLEWIQADIMQAITNSLTVTKESFTYKLGKRLLDYTIRALSQVYEILFELPDYWEFPNYTLAEFRRMEKYLVALSMIHILARYIALTKGC
jgi:hypothetical protein